VVGSYFSEVESCLRNIEPCLYEVDSYVHEVIQLIPLLGSELGCQATQDASPTA
jgi:hypothetical protein